MADNEIMTLGAGKSRRILFIMSDGGPLHIPDGSAGGRPRMVPKAYLVEVFPKLPVMPMRISAGLASRRFLASPIYQPWTSFSTGQVSTWARHTTRGSSSPGKNRTSSGQKP